MTTSTKLYAVLCVSLGFYSMSTFITHGIHVNVE